MVTKTKGDVVDEKEGTFGRSEATDGRGVISTIYFEAGSDVASSTEYLFTLSIQRNNRIIAQTTFEGTTHKKNPSISIPQSALHDVDAKPGHRYKLTAYEMDTVHTEAEMNMSDSPEVLDRTNPRADKTRTDNMEARIYAPNTVEYLNGKQKSVKFRNVANENEAVCDVHSDYSASGVISFPKEIRDELDASPDDLIEIHKTGTKNTEDFSDSENTEDLEEKVDQMYEMLSELYDAYRMSKND